MRWLASTIFGMYEEQKDFCAIRKNSWHTAWTMSVYGGRNAVLFEICFWNWSWCTTFGKVKIIGHLQQGMPDHLSETWHRMYYQRGGYRVGDRHSVEALQWLVYIGLSWISVTHAGNWREIHLAKVLIFQFDGYCQQTNKVYEYLGCFGHGCPCKPNQNKPIDNNDETLLTQYEENLATLQKITCVGYKVV